MTAGWKRWRALRETPGLWHAWPAQLGGTGQNAVVYLDDAGTRTDVGRWYIACTGIEFQLRTGATRPDRTDPDGRPPVPKPERPEWSYGKPRPGNVWDCKPFASWDDLVAWARAEHGILRWEHVPGSYGWIGHTDRVDDARPCTRCPNAAKRDGLCGVHANAASRRAARDRRWSEERAAETERRDRARETCAALEDTRQALLAAIPFEIDLVHDGYHRGDGPSPECAGRLSIHGEHARALADFLSDLTGADLPEYLR